MAAGERRRGGPRAHAAARTRDWRSGPRGGTTTGSAALVERYQKKVFWVAYDVLLDAEEARDVVQETFLRVHAALASYDPSRDFLNWVYRIARNLAIDSFRRRRRRALPVEDLSVPSTADDPALRAGDACGSASRRSSPPCRSSTGWP